MLTSSSGILSLQPSSIAAFLAADTSEDIASFLPCLLLSLLQSCLFVIVPSAWLVPPAFLTLFTGLLVRFVRIGAVYLYNTPYVLEIAIVYCNEFVDGY